MGRYLITSLSHLLVFFGLYLSPLSLSLSPFHAFTLLVILLAFSHFLDFIMLGATIVLLANALLGYG